MRNRAWRRFQSRKKNRRFNFTSKIRTCKIGRDIDSEERFRRQLARSGKTRKDILQDLVA